MPPGHAVHKSVSPTPSALAALHRKQHEELAAYQQREMAVLQQLAMQQQQTSVYAAQLASDGLGFKTGVKRDFENNDLGFDSFISDMKKRKMEPVYDQGESTSICSRNMLTHRYDRQAQRHGHAFSAVELATSAFAPLRALGLQQPHAAGSDYDTAHAHP